MAQIQLISQYRYGNGHIYLTIDPQALRIISQIIYKPFCILLIHYYLDKDLQQF